MNSNIHESISVSNDTFKFGRFTIVKLTDSEGKTGVGISKCSNDDKYNAERGLQIAKGRAEKALYIKKYKKDKKLQHIYMG